MWGVRNTPSAFSLANFFLSAMRRLTVKTITLTSLLGLGFNECGVLGLSQFGGISAWQHHKPLLPPLRYRSDPVTNVLCLFLA